MARLAIMVEVMLEMSEKKKMNENETLFGHESLQRMIYCC
jgi:hypothetical protein